MELDVHAISKNPFEKLNKRWMLLGVTDGEHANAMTAGWGGFGVMWERDVFFCMVRPTRYTFELLKQTDTITLSFFGENYRKELTYLGRTSGRDEDKLSCCGLTPVTDGKLVYFQEASLVLSGRVIAESVLKEQDLLDPALAKFYPNKDYHTMYYCELLRGFTQNEKESLNSCLD